MKKSLFHSTGRFYKASLHTHSTVSDSKLTPEEDKAAYQELGYDIVAYTDHEILVPHPELQDETFLPLTAIECEFKQPALSYYDENGEKVQPPAYLRRHQVYHLIYIAPKMNETYYPWPTRSYVWGNAKDYIQDYYVGEKPRTFTETNVNAAIQDAKDHGFLVEYCHPFWSLNRYDTYTCLKNIDFVEVYNTGCMEEGYFLDDSVRPLDDLLNLGHHVAPTCSDDSHSLRDVGAAATYVRADALTYDKVFESLKNGDTFASTGPVFKEIEFDPETKVLTVESSIVRAISLTTGLRYAKCAGDPRKGTVDRAEFDLKDFIEAVYRYGVPERCFIRLTLLDEYGKKAYTRGYFLPELINL